MACAACDPVWLPVEKAMFCGIAPMVEDGRPMILVLGAFLAGLQLADVVGEAAVGGKRVPSSELGVDLLTFLFFAAGSLSVYNKSKDVTHPVLRFGLTMIVIRLLHELVVYDEAVGPWCTEQINKCSSYGTPIDCQRSFVCGWTDVGGQQPCKPKLTVVQCEEAADEYNAAFTLVPQLAGQLFYCWLLNSYIHVKNAGLLQVADDGSVPAIAPV
jgi:hypothetical protein